MKMTTLGLAAGSAVLLAANPAPATLTGIVVVAERQAPDQLVCNVYARFSEPDDHLVAVCGTASSPLAVNVTANAFDQHLLPPWPGFGSSSLTTTDSGWFITPPDTQGAPDDDGRVLLGRFTYDGSAIDGRMLVRFITGGVHMQAAVEFCHGNSTDPCTEGDLDGNNLVTIDDFLSLLGDWGACGGCQADIDGDGDVDIVAFNSATQPRESITVWLNQGGAQGGVEGTFVDIGDVVSTFVNQEIPQYGNVEVGRPLTVGDVNGDGAIDAFDIEPFLNCLFP